MQRYWRALAVGAAITTLIPAAPTTAQRGEQEWLESCERQAERSRRAVHCEVRTSTLALTGGALRVDAGRNGGAVVRSGPVSQAEISARVQVHADTEAEARELAREVRVVAANGAIRSEGPARSESDRNWSVTYYITVPQNTDLDLVAVNGPIGIYDVTGRINAEAKNGPITLERLGGDVRARVANGPLTVLLAGSRWNGEGLNAETVNGPARLTMPADYSATLELGTINGPMSLNLGQPVTVNGNLRGHISTTVGAGGPTVRVVTRNGPFTARRD